MGKLFYELEAIIANEIDDNEYRALLAKFYYSQPPNKVYRDILKFNISTLSKSQKEIFVDMASRTFVQGPDKRDISSLFASTES
ncbi:MAG: hypothetical protein LBI27_04480 [Clostridiales bacterium]|nr:hypothetical protein [Clostridiales bacterium]